jgi:hypothetical protein
VCQFTWYCSALALTVTPDDIVHCAIVAPQAEPDSSHTSTRGCTPASKVPEYAGCGTMGGRK